MTEIDWSESFWFCVRVGLFVAVYRLGYAAGYIEAAKDSNQPKPEQPPC